jgi:hypothetical protein
MNKKLCRLICGFLLALTFQNADAADKITIIINGKTISAWRTADLESAKKEAIAEHKPIAWIAAVPDVLNGAGAITANGSAGASRHAFYALRDRTVLIYEDGFAENHKVLKLVDDAVHSPDHHPILPVVVFLNPAATEVLAKVNFEPDFVKRAYALADALNQAKAKMNPAPDAEKK